MTCEVEQTGGVGSEVVLEVDDGLFEFAARRVIDTDNVKR